MRKYVLVMIGFLVLSSAQAYAAPDRVGKFDAGISIAGAISTDSDINSAFFIGGNIAYGINQWVAIGFSGGWQEHGTDDATILGETFPGPDISGVPLFGDIIIRIPIEDQPFTPYGIVGIGTVLWDADESISSPSAILVQTEIKDAIAVKVGGGIDWFVNESWIVNFEAYYVFSQPDAEITVSVPGFSATESDELDLDYWTVGGGIKYLFG